MLSWRSSQSHLTVDQVPERATGVQISYSALKIANNFQCKHIMFTLKNSAEFFSADLAQW